MTGRRFTSSLAAAATALLLVTGCASSHSSNATSSNSDVSGLVKPELQLVQLNTISGAAEHMTGGFSVHYELRVANHADEPITLKRVEVQSMGAGAYTIAPYNSSTEKRIEPNAQESVDFWAPATIPRDTIAGVNGPVTIRFTAYFDSARGGFRRVEVQQVHEFGVPGGGGQ